MEFNCEQCNYSSYDKFNYDRHLKTKKHKEKVSNSAKLSKNCHNIVQKLSYENGMECPFCNNVYANAPNLLRHQKTCLMKKELENKYNLIIRELENQNAHLKELLEKENKSKDDMITTLRSENRNLRVLLNNAGSVIKTSISTMSYIVKNYTEAPALEPIQDLPKLHFELSTVEFAEQLILEYRHQTLTQYIGEIILKQYKKDDPKQQSIWNSDTSRLTYIIREIMHNKNLDWRVDKKGLKTTKYIIEPVLDYIGECLEEYLQKTKIGKRTDSTILIVNTMNNFTDANKILQLIEDKIMEDDVLKYIAPHLYVIKDDDINE